MDTNTLPKSEWVIMSPKWARSLLGWNEKNEVVDPSRRADNVGRLSPRKERMRMEFFSRLILAGEWQPGHQGMLLGCDDILLDGANRLGGIVLSGRSVAIQLMRDPTKTSVLQLRNTDRHIPRSAAFTLGRPPEIVKVARFVHELLIGHGGEGFVPTESELETVINVIEDDYNVFLANSKDPKKKAPKFVRTAIFKVPLIVHLHNETASLDYLTRIFDAFMTNDPKSLPGTLPYQFWRQHTGEYSAGKKIIVNRRENASRVYRAFDEGNTAARLTVKSAAFAIKELEVATKKAYGSALGKLEALAS